MNFKSDNVVGVHPTIMDAIVSANISTQNSYGIDEYSLLLQQKMSEIFETDVVVYSTNTGTASNSLALSSLVNPYEIIYCHQESHVQVNECGAPQFYTGGAQLMLLDGSSGKVQAASIRKAFDVSMRPHSCKPGCISLTQASEYGTVYTLDELKDIWYVAKDLFYTDSYGRS